MADAPHRHPHVESATLHHAPAVQAEKCREMGFSQGYEDPHWSTVHKYSCESDLYAMGVCILQVLTGR